ncbi:MAG: efflux RND transporter periplasmic adaptor subunit [Chloroflexota bacterium]
MTFGRIIGIAAIGGIILIATVAVINQPNQQAIEANFDTTTAQLMDIDIDVEATGKIAPAREVPMEFGNNYTVSEIFFDEGDTVREGDVIAMLDMADFDLTVASARNSLDAQSNQFDSIVAPPRDVDLQAAQAGLDAAEADYWAAGQTAPSDEEIAIAEIQIEAAKNDLWQGQLNRDIQEQIGPEFRTNAGQNGNAQLIQLNDGLNQLETGIEVAELQLERTVEQGPSGSAFGASVQALTNAEIVLENTLNPDATDVELAALSIHRAALSVERLEVQVVDMQLVAPFDGIITEMNLEVGELPPRNIPALTLADTSTLTVDLEVDEIDVVNLINGMPVDITVDALPEGEFTGSITSIDLLPIPGESVPTYRVTVTLDPFSEDIRSGMTANGLVVVDELTDVTVVPTQYLEVTTDGTFVTILEAGEVSRVAVTTGRVSGRFTQVVEGVTPGQRIVLPES